MRTTNNLIILITAVFLAFTFSFIPYKSREYENKTIIYNIFPVLGQSNIYYGLGVDSYPVLRTAVPSVLDDGTKAKHFIMMPLTVL